MPSPVTFNTAARRASDSEHPEQWDGLVGAWPLFEGGGATAFDFSGRGQAGTLYGSPTWTPSTVGTGLSLDGVNDYVDTFSTAGNGLTKFSVTAWVAKTTSDYAFILRRTAPDNSATGLELYPTTAYFTVAQSSYGTGYGYVATSLTGIHFYAMVFDGSAAASANRLRGYIDGIEQSLTYAGTLPTTLSSTVANTWKIGLRDTTGTYSHFDCFGVSFFSRALSSADIRGMYGSGPRGHLKPRCRRSAFAVTSTPTTSRLLYLRRRSAA